MRSACQLAYRCMGKVESAQRTDLPVFQLRNNALGFGNLCEGEGARLIASPCSSKSLTREGKLHVSHGLQLSA